MKDYADDILYWQLIQVAFRARHGLMELAESHELTMVQMQALGIVKPGSAVPMNFLASILLCDASNITGIVDRLLQRGLIERTEKPEDRRVKMISLTSEGEKLRRQIFSEFPNYELPQFKQLSEDERACLQGILTKILGLQK